MAILNEKAFKKSLIEYLEYKDLNEVAQLIRSCEFNITNTGQFTGRIWNQTSIDLEVLIPTGLLKKMDEHWSLVEKTCHEIYPEDKNHSLEYVRKKVLINTKYSEDETDTDNFVSVPGGQVYDNLITKVHKIHMDSIEKDYILEACLCAQKGYRLAAATMIGCAAERLLVQLCNSYLSFLKSGNGTPTEIKNFEEKVVNAKKAHARLDGFLRTVQNSEKLFEKIGLENSNLHFSFLDITRQVRNESGHPTGIKVSPEDLSSIFANYQLLIERVHPVITKLPTIQNSVV